MTKESDPAPLPLYEEKKSWPEQLKKRFLQGSLENHSQNKMAQSSRIENMKKKPAKFVVFSELRPLEV